MKQKKISSRSFLQALSFCFWFFFSGLIKFRSLMNLIWERKKKQQEK